MKKPEQSAPTAPAAQALAPAPTAEELAAVAEIWHRWSWYMEHMRIAPASSAVAVLRAYVAEEVKKINAL